MQADHCMLTGDGNKKTFEMRNSGVFRQKNMLIPQLLNYTTT